ncbi:MAG: helix-turn-helix transcriptional regulator [Lachnospiraceae bacterium]|nr:helix-turn-helix transcriptional regulator [Lachnospiraceae bacterium]
MTNELYLEAGKRIHELRKIKGYSREQLAGKAEISTKFLYEIEMGKKGFTADVLYRIAKALEVKCDYILAGSSGEDPCNLYINKMLNKYSDFQKQNVLKILELINEIS